MTARSRGERAHYYVASGTSVKELDNVPTSIRVIDGEGMTRVSVVPWD